MNTVQTFILLVVIFACANILAGIVSAIISEALKTRRKSIVLKEALVKAEVEKEGDAA